MSAVEGSNLAISPCSTPELSMDEALAAYAKVGFRQLEAFTNWTGAKVDYTQPAEGYRDIASRYGMTFSSIHLPAIGEDIDAGVAEAIRCTRFAAELGATVVLFKAKTRPIYIEAAKAYLDGTEGLNITPVLQNHAGQAISSLDDYREVIEGISDARMKTLLEVGHFHAVGVTWRQGYDLLGDSVSLVHIKDMVGAQSVPFGQGEVDLPGLFSQLTADGYTGNYVVEMEVKDKENTLQYLSDAMAYLRTLPEAKP